MGRLAPESRQVCARGGDAGLALGGEAFDLASDVVGVIHVRDAAEVDLGVQPRASQAGAEQLQADLHVARRVAVAELRDDRPLLDGIAASAGENLFAHLALLNALDLRLRGAEIVVTGDDARAHALLAAARKLAFLDRIVLRASAALPVTHPAQDKIKAAESAAFVCVGEACSLPVTEPDAITEAVAAMRRP